jgi:hypothetical protein
VVLLLLDAVWGFAGHLAFSKHPINKAEARWAMINIGAVLILVLFLVAIGAFPPGVPATTPGLEFGVLALALVRTVVDYVVSWKFYVT